MIQEENKEFTKANKELKYTIQSLEKELEEFDELKDSLSKQNKTLGVLFDRGYIDEEGNPLEEFKE